MGSRARSSASGVAVSAAAALVLLATFALGASDARADVAGTITLTGSAGKPPARGKAFLDRAENPLTPARPLDPMPHLVVVLEPASGDAPLPPAPQVKWELLGASFARPLLAVVVNAEVVIQNRSRRAPTLVVDGHDGLLPESPLDPRGERAFKVTAPGLYPIVDEDTPYLRGAVLAVATPWFATPDAKGKFTLADVPDGAYTVKVWYRTGWLAGADTTVTVEKGKAKLDLKLPPGLQVQDGSQQK